MEDQEELLHSLGAHVDALMGCHAERSKQQRLIGGGEGGLHGAAKATAEVASELSRVKGRVAVLEGILEEGRRTALTAKQVTNKRRRLYECTGQSQKVSKFG